MNEINRIETDERFCPLKAFANVCNTIEEFEQLKEELRPLATEIAYDNYPDDEVIRLKEATIRKLSGLLIVNKNI